MADYYSARNGTKRAAIFAVNRPLLSLLFSVVVIASPAPACMNDYVPNVAAIERSKSVLDQLQKHVEKEPWAARRDRLRKELAAGGDYKVKNDLATSLAHTGEAAEAVALLEQIEAEKPGLYATATNLGTAYELAGNDEKALEWIRKGIELNPSAHEGSEWLHVKILEAKLALKNDPKWLNSHSIIDPVKDVGATGLSAVGNRGEKLSTRQIENAVIYQLHERLQFVKPPDAVVGALLLNLTMLIWEEPVGPRASQDVLGLSNTYLQDLPDMDEVQTIAELAGIRVHNASKRSLPRKGEGDVAALAVIGIVGVLLGTLVVGLRRLIQKRRAAERTAVLPEITG